MNIGVYDKNCPSGLDVVKAFVLERGGHIVDYHTLPDSVGGLPPKFLVNPTFSEIQSHDYWVKLRSAIGDNPTTEFGVLVPNFVREAGEEIARVSLANLANATIFGCDAAERLFDFLEEQV